MIKETLCPCCKQPMHTEVSTSLLGTHLTTTHTCYTIGCDFETVTLEVELWAEMVAGSKMWDQYAGMKRRADARKARMMEAKFG